MEMTRGSVAFDYSRQYEREEFRREEIAAKPVRKSGAAARRALLLIVAVFVTAACIALLYMKAQVYKAQRDVNELQAQIKEARSLNGNLSEQLSEAMNINSIMSRAGNLGMTYPDNDQVLYVTFGENQPNIEMKSNN